jgi:hypothetical protein
MQPLPALPRGRQPAKQTDGPPRAFAKFQTHPPTIQRLFSLAFFCTFLGVSQQGKFTNTQKNKRKKKKEVHVKNVFREKSQKIDKNFDIRFSSTFFLLLRFQVLLSNGSSKTQQKTFYKTNRVEKFLQKNRQKPETVFSRFLGKGSSKTR